MNHIIIYWASFIGIVLIILWLDRKRALLRDVSTATRKPFSFSKVQLAWWTTIILSAVISTVIYAGDIPTFNESTLILFGISVATTGAAAVTDMSDMERNGQKRHQDSPSEGIILDILSDKDGVSIARFQTVALNIIFGLWYVHSVLSNIALPGTAMDKIFPVIATSNLVLLGISYGAYAGLKTTENRV